MYESKSLLSHNIAKNILHFLLQCNCPARMSLQQQPTLTYELGDRLNKMMFIRTEMT